jgi:hypothetical protein
LALGEYCFSRSAGLFLTLVEYVTRTWPFANEFRPLTSPATRGFFSFETVVGGLALSGSLLLLLLGRMRRVFGSMSD